MKKTIKSKQVEALTEPAMAKEAAPKPTGPMDIDSKKVYSFPVGTSFMLQGSVYRVVKAMREMNTDMRICNSHLGQEIFTVTTLQNDAVSDPSFTVVD